MSIFHPAIQGLARCHGYTINRISLSVIDDVDSLEIGFRWGPSKPDIVVSMQGIYYFANSKIPGADALYVDTITAVILPAEGLWPAGLPSNFVRMKGMPPLLWIRAEPVHVEIVAAVVSVLLALPPG